jgi:hypothetical protein
MQVILSFTFLFFLGTVANAGTCDLNILRQACPGKDAEAFAPYKGVNPTFMRESAANEEDCSTKAQQYSLILRKRVISQIAVSPTYENVALPTVITESACSSEKNKK